MQHLSRFCVRYSLECAGGFNYDCLERTRMRRNYVIYPRRNLINAGDDRQWFDKSRAPILRTIQRGVKRRENVTSQLTKPVITTVLPRRIAR